MMFADKVISVNVTAVKVICDGGDDCSCAK